MQDLIVGTMVSELHLKAVDTLGAPTPYKYLGRITVKVGNLTNCE